MCSSYGCAVARHFSLLHAVLTSMVRNSDPVLPLCDQCGDFYEAIGTDAVILVQFAGLNPMGNRSPPRAGCPKGNIHRVLADLVQGAGLTVVSLGALCARVCRKLFNVHSGVYSGYCTRSGLTV